MAAGRCRGRRSRVPPATPHRSAISHQRSVRSRAVLGERHVITGRTGRVGGCRRQRRCIRERAAAADLHVVKRCRGESSGECLPQIGPPMRRSLERHRRRVARAPGGEAGAGYSGQAVRGKVAWPGGPPVSSSSGRGGGISGSRHRLARSSRDGRRARGSQAYRTVGATDDSGSTY